MRTIPTFSLREQLQEEPVLIFLLLLILYMICGAILVPGILAILELSFQLEPGNMQAILGGDFSVHPRSRTIFRLAQISHQLLTWGFLALILAAILGKMMEQLMIRPPQHQVHIPLAVGLLLASIPFAQFLYLSPEQIPVPENLVSWKVELIQAEQQSAATLRELLSGAGIGVLGLNLLVFALLPAICEEFFFRGILQRKLSEMMDVRWAILLTGLLFSLVHFQLSGLISRWWLGALLGWLLWRSGSIWPGILAHFVFNASLVSYTWWSTQQVGEEIAVNQGIAWNWAPLSLAATLSLMWWFARLAMSNVRSKSSFS